MVNTRIVQLFDPNHGPRLGIVEGDISPSKSTVDASKIIDLTSINPDMFKDFLSLLEAAQKSKRSLSRVIQNALSEASQPNVYPGSVLITPPGQNKVSLIPPVIPHEVWGAGVTYKRSREAREVETQSKGIYDRVYEATRPEIYLKTSGFRVVGHLAQAGIRSDSTWSVPEPELTLILGYGNPPEIIGITIGNDMSARDIEGENPLYLPQAKIFNGCCVLGPAIVPIEEIPDLYNIRIAMTIERENSIVFKGETMTSDLKRTFDELVEYLARSNTILPGTAFVTGTGVVPPDDFSLEAGDIVRIQIPEIGLLENQIVRV